MRSATRETRVDGDVDAAQMLVRAALAAVGATGVGVDPATGRVRARTGASWRSWGERVAVDLIPDGTSTRVRVHVETAVGLTVVDWGATRTLADRIVRAVTDPQWASDLLSRPGPSALARRAIWLGVVAAGVAAWAAMPSPQHERDILLVAAVVAAGAWTVGILVGALRVRRRGQFASAGQLALQMGVLFVVGFPTADALQPRHASVAENFSATMSAALAATAVAALIATAVRRTRRRVRATGVSGAG